jgi:SAM-dependent methyltransferase
MPTTFFDRVLSGLLFHHLNGHDKLCALQEAFRVLRPGGSLHIADWGGLQIGACEQRSCLFNVSMVSKQLPTMYMAYCPSWSAELA